MTDLTFRELTPEEAESRRLAQAVIDEHLARVRARIQACADDGGHRWHLLIDDSQPMVCCAKECGAEPPDEVPLHMDPIPVTWQAKREVTVANPIIGPVEVGDVWIQVTPASEGGDAK